MSWLGDPSRDLISHHNDIPLSLPIALTYRLVLDGSPFDTPNLIYLLLGTNFLHCIVE